MAHRLITTIQPNVSLANNQPNARYDLELRYADASNWRVAAAWDVPESAVSGVYIAKLTRDDGVFGENQIIFVVRDDEGGSDMLFQTSDTTWEAYNSWGGSSYYGPNYPSGRALAVSYSRPFANRDVEPNQLFLRRRIPDDPLLGAERV